ncbi:MAG: nuclear transport factor 2 family protein [Rhodospirillaceae bacterium]|jgi:ketosteroid isomerase-like protein|nr:nuclear transport factor 2 family protein [Rhodospirillaceae bacterium]MBT3495003.1 nuclear transport factor 2 family protein [Rhodospirillaceae bacterium]MBT3780577.1 nuclear transport factor 2 family protein [Rhodospirillaceae bacterium]MBT3975789.1 nuclear transport factor 2 family protein [Rhodospirillaceae bacterium]MBT4168515.1 nuclear transport factor 2 family protein [Rhodospirillaceae bacterium]
MTNTTDAKVQLLLDREDISQVLYRYATAIDTRDWELLASCFTEDLEADFRSFGGREVVKGRDTWMKAITSTIQGLDATQHLTANHVHTVDGDSATLVAYLQALHRLDTARSDPEYTVGGYYTCEMVRGDDAKWRMRRYALAVTWHRGNRDILRQAQRRLTK